MIDRGANDGAYQQSLDRLSLHLATRPPKPEPVELPPLPPPARKRWPVVVLIAVAAIAAITYHYVGVGHEVRAAAPHAAEAATTVPVMAAAKAAPQVAPVQQAPTLREPAPVNQVATTLPAPPPPPEAAPLIMATAPAAEAAAASPEPPLSRDEILELQKRLLAVGINPGPPDGVPGRRTTVGVQRYEEQHNLPVTGMVDRRLLRLLQQAPASVPAEARAR